LGDGVQDQKMSLKSLPLKKSYDSDVDNILVDFYIPALSCSFEYMRLTGFFSSTTLAIAAKGIASLVRNGGKMKLVTGARFEEEDIRAIKESCESPEEILKDKMLRNLASIENAFVKDHVRALAWMIANGRLKIRIAIVLSDNGYPSESKAVEKQGIFHQKVGILQDLDGNKVSFSGSENESASGWQGNIEEFKVFRSWEKEEAEYLESDLEKFNRFWEGQTSRTKIIDIPIAIEEKLIEIAPKHIEELDLWKWEQSSPNANKLRLRDYQKKAVDCWVENGKCGILEMATGTGKTFTALACLETILRTENKLVAVISSPYNHLSEQWIGETERFGIRSEKMVCDSTQTNWKNKLVDNVLDVENGIVDRLVIFTTHNTFSSSDFIEIIRQSKKRVPSQKFFLIIDEVHGIGAPIRRKGLIKEYDFRLGLSATPKRWFDFEGTEKLFGYFKDVVFSFTLKDAIDSGYLTPYIYKPHFACLTNEEMKKYEEETRKVSRAYYASKDDVERDEAYTLLCIKRQRIIRNAKNKLVQFQQILAKLVPLEYCLIYCSPQQIRIVQKILNDNNIIQHKFTQKEGTKPEAKFDGLSERDFLIKKFSEGIYQALVSMKCLDEGVDVPPARLAIILDNSGNPREYIQRRGRVLRRFPNKTIAVIHDIIVEPMLRPNTPDELKELEKKIISRELQRYRDFAISAKNSEECLRVLKEIEAQYGL
jgi:superfamily II DNA or RNA helicase